MINLIGFQLEEPPLIMQNSFSFYTKLTQNATPSACVDQ